MDITSYKKTITELAMDLATLEVYSKQLEMENTEVTLHELNERIKNDRFNLAVLGEFRRGKSTLINALLRTPVLPSDIVPTTASVNRITYDPQPKARVEYFDGTSHEIALEELADYATQDGEKRDNVREVTVWYPTVYCSNNVDIYDTPGLNDTEEMTRATMDVIDKMDIAIFTLAANVNFSASESEFLSERLLTSNVGRVIFVITRMGEYTPEQRERIINSVRRGIEQKVMSKARDVFADDPEQLEAFENKLGDIQIYGVDSVMALEARKNHDEELLEKSGYRAFERGIDEMLTRERGRVMLEKETGMILKTTTDIFNIIQMRMSPLTMNEEEFLSRCESAEKKIREIQERTGKEFARLDESAKTVTDEALSTWNGYVEEIKTHIRELIDGVEITKADLKKANREDFTRTLWQEKVQPSITHEVQVYSEKIQNQVNDAVGRECEGLDAYADEVSGYLEEISLLLAPTEKKDSAASMAGHILLNYLTLGGGSLALGYKHAGAKGALVGGLAGTGITFATAYATGLIAAAVGLVGWPVLVCGGLIASLIGVMGGKGIVKSVFWKDSAEKFRRELADAACMQFENSLAENHFTDRLAAHIQDTFRAIRNEIGNSTVKTVGDMQAALQKSKEDFAADKAKTEEKLQDYGRILESLSAISERTAAVREAYGLDEVPEAEAEAEA